jgi:hypothetical protein
MLDIFIGLFIVFHGLVHGLYFGQSAKLFELRPGMLWPDGSWAFSKILGDKIVRILACISFILADFGFLVGGVFFITNLTIWQPIVMVSAIFSSMIYLLFWDGKMKKLGDKGGFGILINIAILAGLIVF